MSKIIIITEIVYLLCLSTRYKMIEVIGEKCHNRKVYFYSKRVEEFNLVRSNCRALLKYYQPLLQHKSF